MDADHVPRAPRENREVDEAPMARTPGSAALLRLVRRHADGIARHRRPPCRRQRWGLELQRTSPRSCAAAFASRTRAADALDRLVP